jgi:hypothetical protein
MTSPLPLPNYLDVDIDGDNTQSVTGTAVSGDVVQIQVTYTRDRSAMFLSHGEIQGRLACYVPVRNHDAVVKMLDANRAVVLTGPRGSGRETVAIAAIRQLRPGIELRRFSLEDEDAEELKVRSPCGYLIHADDGGLVRLGRCAEVVLARGGYLAVIAKRETPTTAALGPAIPLDRPDAVSVYRNWVARDGLAEWVHWPRAQVLLEAALPVDARRLADLVVQVVRRGGGDLAARQNEVEQAYLGWDEELRRWFSDHLQPHDRALLVAAATVHSGAAEGYIYEAASSLARRLQIEVNGGGLAWCPVTGLRALLDSRPDDEAVVFGRIGYVGSILRHAVADYPLARQDLLGWLAALPTEEAARYGVANPVTEAFADLAAERGADADIIEAARGWGGKSEADLAFIVLSRTCLHPRVGTQVRRALYDWSRAARTPQTLKLTIARVCEPLGQSYPSVALTRLKHLATHGDLQVIRELMITARALIAEGHGEEVRSAVLDWCGPTSLDQLSEPDRRRRRRAGALMFLELAGRTSSSGGPEILCRGREFTVRSCLWGWRAILDFSSSRGFQPVEIERVVRLWLDAAADHAGLRTQISALLVAAAAPQPGAADDTQASGQSVFSADFMIAVVRRWAADHSAESAPVQIEETIVIGLTRHWWLRRIRILIFAVRRQRRERRR